MSATPRCPHCQAELRLLPDGGVPQLCPYCGDELPLDVGPSLARLLRTDAAPPQALASDASDATPPPDPAAAIQEDAMAADNGADLTVPEATRTSEPVIEPETMRPPTADTDAADTTPIEAADISASPMASKAIDLPDSAEDATEGHATSAVAPEAQDAGERQTGERDDATPVPSFLGHPRHAARIRVPPWQWAAAACLMLLLGFQLVYVQRDALASRAQWRPWMHRLCDLTGCTLAPWRELSAFRMLGRDVRAVAGRAGVLQVQATFRNDAAWPQPLPDLRVSLSDADGRVLGARVLHPVDYLPSGDPGALVAPGQSVQATALLGEPDAPSVAFAFEFR